MTFAINRFGMENYMKLLDSMEKLFFGGYVDESYEEYEEEEKEL